MCPGGPGAAGAPADPRSGPGVCDQPSGYGVPGPSPFRRIHLDTLAEPVEKGRQRLESRLTVLLRDEGVAALKAAKASHDALEAVYNPYVDFEGVRAQAALEAGRLLSWLEQ